MRALRSKPLPARAGQRAVREMAVFQRQQQERVDENEERSGGAHGRIAADLRLAETEQGFFVAEVEFDFPAPQVGLQDLLGRQGGIAADQVSGIAVAEMRAFSSR